jgi:hypothetical protein
MFCLWFWFGGIYLKKSDDERSLLFLSLSTNSRKRGTFLRKSRTEHCLAPLVHALLLTPKFCAPCVLPICSIVSKFRLLMFCLQCWFGGIDLKKSDDAHSFLFLSLGELQNTANSRKRGNFLTFKDSWVLVMYFNVLYCTAFLAPLVHASADSTKLCVPCVLLLQWCLFHHGLKVRTSSQRHCDVPHRWAHCWKVWMSSQAKTICESWSGTQSSQPFVHYLFIAWQSI